MVSINNKPKSVRTESSDFIIKKEASPEDLNFYTIVRNDYLKMDSMWERYWASHFTAIQGGLFLIISYLTKDIGLSNMHERFVFNDFLIVLISVIGLLSSVTLFAYFKTIRRKLEFYYEIIAKLESIILTSQVIEIAHKSEQKHGTVYLIEKIVAYRILGIGGIIIWGLIFLYKLCPLLCSIIRATVRSI